MEIFLGPLGLTLHEYQQDDKNLINIWLGSVKEALIRKQDLNWTEVQLN